MRIHLKGQWNVLRPCDHGDYLVKCCWHCRFQVNAKRFSCNVSHREKGIAIPVMKPATQQSFTIPGPSPLLEIRTTIGSVLPYAEHFHSSFSFGLILDGRTCFSLGKEKQVAETGDIVLVAPDLVHSCNPVGEARSYRMAHVDAVWFHEYLGMELYQECGLRVAVPLIRDAELFAEAYDLLDAACADTAEIGTGLTALLTKMQARHQCFLPAQEALERNAAPLADISTTDSSMMERILEGDYSVSELAHSAGVRRESFSRSFHRATGLPPSHYLHCLRLEHGRRLLREGCSVAEAAIASGYVDQSHFHRMFVRYCSVTPGCYRRKQSHPYKK
ncbi:MAG: HTH-type transcriptional activator RhaR [Desulfovibrio sp.]